MQTSQKSSKLLGFVFLKEGKIFAPFLKEFCALSFHAGPKSDVTNSKKLKKCETFVWRHFISPRCGTISNLDKINLPESPFIKMTYHV
jgi:hypothetical protein